MPWLEPEAVDVLRHVPPAHARGDLDIRVHRVVLRFVAQFGEDAGRQRGRHFDLASPHRPSTGAARVTAPAVGLVEAQARQGPGDHGWGAKVVEHPHGGVTSSQSALPRGGFRRRQLCPGELLEDAAGLVVDLGST